MIRMASLVLLALALGIGTAVTAPRTPSSIHAATATAHSPPAAARSRPASRVALLETQPTPDADSILSEARARYEALGSLKASFRQSIEMRVFEPPRRREGSGTWYQERPDRFRMDFSDPEGDVIVSDGSHLWLYYPSTHPDQVIRSELAGERARGNAAVDLQGRIFREAAEHFQARYAGADTLGGERVHRIVLSPAGPEAPYRRVELWIDAGSLLVRRLLLEDRSETVRTVTLEDLRTGIPLADSLFRFRPPAGVEVFEG